MLDRFFITCNGLPAERTLRGLVAAVSCQRDEFAAMVHEIDAGLWGGQAVTFPQSSLPRRSGKIPTFLLNPDDSWLVMKLLAYRVRPIDVERWMADRGLRALQIERLQNELFPSYRDTRDTRDTLSIWGNSTRRLRATAILLKQRTLIRLGLPPLHAFVEAFDFDARRHPLEDALSLSRLVKEVMIPTFSGGSVRLNHCEDCQAVFLSDDQRLSALECPICCLVYRKKLGHQRRWKNYLESIDRPDDLPLAA